MPGKGGRGKIKRVKHPDTRAALDHYDFLSEPDDHGEICALPEQPAPVHALLKPQPSRFEHDDRLWEAGRSNAPLFLERHSYQRAACGKFVKVVLPLPFDDVDPDTCRACAREITSWAADPAAWWAGQYRRQASRWEREDEEDAIALWRAREDQRRAVGERQETSEL